MALTQITTKGIKDSTIATIDLADDAVTQGKLADDAVGAPHLNTAATGSNGQFLKKDDTGAGGITWSNLEVKAHLLPDTTDTHNLGSTSKRYGGLFLGNNAVTKFGNSQELEIYYDATDSIIKTSEKLKISTTANDDDIEITPNGSGNIKLDGLAWPNADGSSGQYLKTDGSGGLSFGTVTIPPAGATLDLVADGAIAAGKPCIVNTSGKAEQVKYAATMQATPTIYIGSTDFTSNEIGPNPELVFDPDLSVTLSKGVCWTIFSHDADSIKFKVRAALNTAWGQDMGDTIQLNSAGGNTGQCDITYDTQNNKPIMAYRCNNEIKVRTLTATNVTSSAITLNAEVVGHSSASNPKVEYGTGGKFLLLYKVSSSSYEAKVGTVASNGTITFGTAVSVFSGSELFRLNAFYASNIDKFLIVYTRSNDSEHGYCKIATISGTSVSFGTEVEFNNTVCNGVDAAWDSKNQKFVLIFNADSTSYLYAIQGTVSGTDISFGSSTQISGDYNASRPRIGYSPLGELFLCTFKNPTASNRLSARSIKINGTGFTISSGTGTNLNDDNVSSNYSLAVPTIVMGTGPDLVAFTAHRRSGSSNQGRFARLNFIDSGSNLNSNKENFLGFAPSAINDGATGTINLAGNTVANQSGLTAGNGYAVQNDGTLGGTLNSSGVGLLALTSSTGLIKGY